MTENRFPKYVIDDSECRWNFDDIHGGEALYEIEDGSLFPRTLAQISFDFGIAHVGPSKRLSKLADRPGRAALKDPSARQKPGGDIVLRLDVAGASTLARLLMMNVAWSEQEVGPDGDLCRWLGKTFRALEGAGADYETGLPIITHND